MPVFVLPFPAIDPVLVHIGPVAIRWYALAYIFGILLGWLYARAIIRNAALWGGKPPFTAEAFDDFIVWVTLGVILGGRLGYVLFYNPEYFAAHPLQVLELWSGGMSFHGGFFGCVVAVVLFAKRRGLPVLSLGDIICAVGPIGLFLGRLANFINGELWGRAADVPWAMVFPGAGEEPRHPSQLYEAFLEGIVPFVILRIATHRYHALTRPGTVFGLFLVCYGIFRSTAEFFREPHAGHPLDIGVLTPGIAYSIPMILIGAWLIWRARQEPALAA